MISWRPFTCFLLAIFLLGWGNPAQAKYGNGIPVLLYHHVSDNKTELPDLTVTTAEFERQMAILHEAGFQTISPRQFIAYMEEKQVILPEKPILITFDDGYEDNYTNAFPVLKHFDFRAVIFMVGINIDREQRLSSRQIREMAAQGITFGSHTMTHRDLTALNGSELRHEVKDSKQKLERLTRQDAALFSYPYGYFNLSDWEAVEMAGYKAAFTVLPGLNDPARDNLFLLRRIPIYNTTDFNTLFFLLDKNQPKTKLLEYTPVFSQ